MSCFERIFCSVFFFCLYALFPVVYSRWYGSSLDLLAGLGAADLVCRLQDSDVLPASQNTKRAAGAVLNVRHRQTLLLRETKRNQQTRTKIPPPSPPLQPFNPAVSFPPRPRPPNIPARAKHENSYGSQVPPPGLRGVQPAVVARGVRPQQGGLDHPGA